MYAYLAVALPNKFSFHTLGVRQEIAADFGALAKREGSVSFQIFVTGLVFCMRQETIADAKVPEDSKEFVYS